MLLRTIGMRPALQCSRLVPGRTLYTAHTMTAGTRTQSPFSAGSETTSSEPASSRRRWARHVIGSSVGEEMKAKKVEEEAEHKAAPTSETQRPAAKRRRRALKPLKSPITLTPTAMDHLRALNRGPDPKLIRISVRNRGCSGLSYQLEYVDKPEKFDEIVVQDDVKVVIDSKALFSVIGSEMDWVDTTLSSKFVFKNPNSKGTCGCGESFMV